MIERLVSSSDMLHFAFGQSSSFVKQWSWVKQSKLGKTLPVSSRFIKCAQVFRAKKLHWNDGKACQSWGSGCPFPLPAQQQNHALWWNDVLRNLTMDDHGTYNLVIRFCSPRIVRLAAWSVSGGRLTVKRLQLFKYTKITDLSTALCALCMLFSQIRKPLGPLQCYVVSPPRELFRGELASTMPQYHLFGKQGVLAKKSSCRNTASLKMFVPSRVRMIACHQVTLSSCPQCPICCLLAPQRALTQIERCAKTGKCTDTSMSCWTTSASPDFRFFLSSACILRQCATAKLQVLFFCSQHTVPIRTHGTSWNNVTPTMHHPKKVWNHHTIKGSQTCIGVLPSHQSEKPAIGEGTGDAGGDERI